MREQVEVGMRKDSDLKLPMSLTPMFHRINLNNESIWEWLPPTKDAASVDNGERFVQSPWLAYPNPRRLQMRSALTPVNISDPKQRIVLLRKSQRREFRKMPPACQPWRLRQTVLETISVS